MSLFNVVAVDHGSRLETITVLRSYPDVFRRDVAGHPHLRMPQGREANVVVDFLIWVLLLGLLSVERGGAADRDSQGDGACVHAPYRARDVPANDMPVRITRK